MPADQKQQAIPRTCDARVCRHCRITDRDKDFMKPRPLTTDDLRWHFGEAESALGMRSTLGAFVDMALSGIQGGGKSNGVENRAVEQHRLDATARHRCIRQRLRGVPEAVMSVLRAAYGPDDWTACHSQVELRRGQPANPLTAPEVYAAARRSFAPELLRLAPMTALAVAFERRKRLLPHAAPKPRKDPPAEPANARQAIAALFERDPLLARSARGAVLLAACGVCPGCAGSCEAPAAIIEQATKMLDTARRAAQVAEPEKVRAPKIRVHRSRPVEVSDG